MQQTQPTDTRNKTTIKKTHKKDATNKETQQTDKPKTEKNSNTHTIWNKQAHLILATSLAGVRAVSSLSTAEVARLALALVPANNQGETDVFSKCRVSA